VSIRADEIGELAVGVRELDLAFTRSADEKALALRVPRQRVVKMVALGEFEGGLALAELLGIHLQVGDEVIPDLCAMNRLKAGILSDVIAETLYLHVH